MATKQVTALTQDVALGDAGNGEVTTKVIHWVPGTLVGSVIITARVTGTSATPRQIPYKKRYLNGAVADDSTVTTPITGESIIEVNAAGLEITFSYTHTSGAGPGTLYTADLDG